MILVRCWYCCGGQIITTQSDLPRQDVDTVKLWWGSNCSCDCQIIMTLTWTGILEMILVRCWYCCCGWCCGCPTARVMVRLLPDTCTPPACGFTTWLPPICNTYIFFIVIIFHCNKIFSKILNLIYPTLQDSITSPWKSKGWQKDGQTDDRQIDPNVVHCFAGLTKILHGDLPNFYIKILYTALNPLSLIFAL